MKTSNTDGRSPQQLVKEREQRKRNYWHTHDSIKTKILTELAKGAK